MQSLIFAGTPAFSVPILQALCAAGVHVPLVLTQPDRPAHRGRQLTASPVKQAAQRLGCPVRTPTHLKDPDVLDHCLSLQVETMLVVAYGHWVPPKLLTGFPWGCLNIHASLLPRWRGASPIQSALRAGDDVTGVSLMQMATGMDTGDVWTQHRCPIDPSDTNASLHLKLSMLAADTIVADLHALHAGKLTATPQDTSLVTLAPKWSKADGCLDWAAPAKVLERLMRACHPWPSAHTTCQGHTFKCLAGVVLDTPPVPSAPGTVQPSAASDGCLDVVCGDGHTLRITELQWPGKRAMHVRDFLRGHPGMLTPGTVLGQ